MALFIIIVNYGQLYLIKIIFTKVVAIYGPTDEISKKIF